METIASRIHEKKVFENGIIFIAPTGARDIVSFEGSVLGGSNFIPDSLNKVPTFAASLFDSGTKTKSKDTIQDSLAARGASLYFSSGGDRTYFSGSCLPEDLSFVLSLTAECLHDAIFPAKELTSARERALGRLKQSKTDTRGQASQELARMLYDSTHVNYVETDATTEKRLKAVERQDLLTFKKILGRGGLILAVVGDVTEQTALRAAEKAFGTLKVGISKVPVKSKNKKIPAAGEKLINIPDKTNIDLYLGVGISITTNDDQFIPLATLTEMLGGGFAAHLMQTVRERDGLTYGISARLADFTTDTEGAFRVWSTLSPLLYEKGLATIRKEIKAFFANGITEEALSLKKDEILGTYVVGLATTRGLASQLHSIGIRGKELSYIDEYRALIRAVTLDDLHEAAALIPLNKLSLSAAGTFLKK